MVSKVLTVLFKPPSIAPTTDKQFLNLEKLQKETQSARGPFLLAVQSILNKFIDLDNTCKELLMAKVRKTVRETCHSHVVAGYSHLLYFITEVRKRVLCASFHAQHNEHHSLHVFFLLDSS